MMLGSLLCDLKYYSDITESGVSRANDFLFKKNAFSVSHLVNSVYFSVSAHFVHPEVD